MWAVYEKEECLFSQSIYFLHKTFFYFLEGQLHKDTKLGIVTNVGKSRLVTVIFANIQKMSDASANSFGKYIRIVECMRNVFTFY